MPLTPTEQEVSQWLAVVRAAAPGWGVLYDPHRVLWLAVRGQRTLLVASTPAELALRIAAHTLAAGLAQQPSRTIDPSARAGGLPPGVAPVARRPRMARLRP